MWEIDINPSDFEAAVAFMIKENINFTTDGDDHYKIFVDSASYYETVHAVIGNR